MIATITTGNMKRRTAEQALKQAKAQGIEHVHNDRGMTIAIRHTVVETELTSSVTGKGTGIMRDEHRYTLSFNDKRPDEQPTFYPAAIIIMDYFSDNSMPYGVNDFIDIYSNQAEREGTVLAIIDDQILVEYEMPAGTSAMLQYTVHNGELTKRVNVNYNTCPKRWINAIHDGEMDWLGCGQRMFKALPLPARS